MPFSEDDARKIGEEIGIDWDKVDFEPKDLATGMNVELEHGTKVDEQVNITEDDPAMTAKIAWAHLMEAPTYYELLAEMEKQLGADEKQAKTRRAYQIQLDPSKRWEKPQLSPEMDKYMKEYVQDLEAAVKNGMSADDAFKKILPDLDELAPDDLVNLLWENKHLGGRGSLVKYKDWLTALDIFDLIQKILERAVWESAVYWWATQNTKKQTKQPQQKSTQQDQNETVVIKKKNQPVSEAPTVPIDDAKTNPKTGRVFRYRGHTYAELKRGQK